MKTLITTFAIAMMVFAFNTNVSANEEARKALEKFDCVGEWTPTTGLLMECSQISEVQSLDQEEKDKVVAFLGWGFCQRYRGAKFCEDENWWNPDKNGGKLASLSDEEIDQKIASAIDYCQKNDCASLNSAGESQIAVTHTDPQDRTLACEIYPGMWLCGGDWWNEDAESKDGFGGRDVADSGEEGSTSSASAGDQ